MSMHLEMLIEGTSSLCKLHCLTFPRLVSACDVCRTSHPRHLSGRLRFTVSINMLAVDRAKQHGIFGLQNSIGIQPRVQG